MTKNNIIWRLTLASPLGFIFVWSGLIFLSVPPGAKSCSKIHANFIIEKIIKSHVFFLNNHFSILGGGSPPLPPQLSFFWIIMYPILNNHFLILEGIPPPSPKAKLKKSDVICEQFLSWFQFSLNFEGFQEMKLGWNEASKINFSIFL